VDEGFYANRTDFLRTVIRRQLEIRAGVVNDTTARRTPHAARSRSARRTTGAASSRIFAPPVAWSTGIG
jgi:Ribbon-Helix-Helix transcriptional regulator family